MLNRRLSPIWSLALLAMVSACSAPAALLNSERIEARFGSYGVSILEQSPTLRRTNLFSTDNGTTTCRTYAVVEFHQPIQQGLDPAHREILDGASIGATLTKAGWRIDKQTVHIGELGPIDSQHSIGMLMQLQRPTVLAFHAYHLLVSTADHAQVHYATIIETHHPDYLGIDELRRLYPANPDVALSADQAAALHTRVTGGS